MSSASPCAPRRRAPPATERFGNDAQLSSIRILSAEGRHGEVRFFLQRVSGGLYVEREEIPRRGLHTMLAVEFTDPGQFGRWCDDDPIRFDHPLLHVHLKRDGDDLWRSLDGGSGIT